MMKSRQTEHFRAFAFDQMALDRLPVEIAGMILKLAPCFNFSTGEPIGRDRVSVTEAARLVGVSRNTMKAYIRKLDTWQKATGWEYFQLRAGAGLTMVVENSRVGKWSNIDTMRLSRIDHPVVKNRPTTWSESDHPMVKIRPPDAHKPLPDKAMGEPYEVLSKYKKPYQREMADLSEDLIQHFEIPEEKNQ